MGEKCRERVKSNLRLKNPRLKVSSTSEMGFMRHEWRIFKQQDQNNMLLIIFPVVDAIFNCSKHFSPS